MYIQSLQINKFLENYFQTEEKLYYDKKSNTLYKYTDNRYNVLRLPLIYDFVPEELNADNFLEMKVSHGNYMIIVITTGQALLGIINGRDILEHKVIRKYMVRKKQGKSQIKYLKTKGKSRLGSRIRLKNSVYFFEEINFYLNNWYSEYEISRIMYFIPKNLVNIWFNSKVLPPFQKDDGRLIKMPYNNIEPKFEYLKKLTDYIYNAYVY